MPKAMHGTSIRIFLADGTPDGLRIVEKSNWTGRALVASRAQYVDVRNREEFNRPSVYVLRGPSEKPGFDSKLYIGEADEGRRRLDNHARTKDFWTSFVLFTSKDENLNKAHVKYLESRLIGLAQEAKRVELENSNNPSIPALSEADVADVESFLEEMLQIYPLLGIDAFTKPKGKGRSQDKLFLRGKEAEAQGKETPEGFLVFRGATVRKETTDSTHQYVLDLRERLLEEGVLEDQKEGLRLTQDYLFSSPSTAAAVVMGRNANGRTEWKDKGGKTLKQIQEAALDSSSNGGE